MRPSPTERPGQRYQRGSFTVEFALVVPILIAILFGVIDAGRFIATRTMLSQAAAAAARAACLSSTTGSSDLTQAANDAAPKRARIDITTRRCRSRASYRSAGRGGAGRRGRPG